jgi:hypothetical protein
MYVVWTDGCMYGCVYVCVRMYVVLLLCCCLAHSCVVGFLERWGCVEPAGVVGPHHSRFIFVCQGRVGASVLCVCVCVCVCVCMCACVRERESVCVFVWCGARICPSGLVCALAARASCFRVCSTPSCASLGFHNPSFSSHPLFAHYYSGKSV